MKVLVIGYGSIGKRHIGNLSLFPDIEIIVCTNRKTDNFLKEKKCQLYSSLDKCIEQKPDVAFITNVTSQHIKTAIKLASAHIDLFIEKPLSNSMSNVNKLLKMVEKNHLVTLMGCHLRFHPCLKKIKELVSNNEIGTIVSIHAENGSYLPEWHPGEDYELSYAGRKDMGGGTVLTNIHEIDYLYWFFGNVKEVYSITGKFSDLKINVEDISSILLYFNRRVIGEIHLDYFQRPNTRTCKIVGTKGTIFWDYKINTVEMYDVNKKSWIKKLRLKNYDNNSMHVQEIKHFFECVKNRKKTINDISEGKKVLQIALAIKKSSQLKKVVLVN